MMQLSPALNELHVVRLRESMRKNNKRMSRCNRKLKNKKNNNNRKKNTSSIPQHGQRIVRHVHISGGGGGVVSVLSLRMTYARHHGLLP